MDPNCIGTYRRGIMVRIVLKIGIAFTEKVSFLKLFSCYFNLIVSAKNTAFIAIEKKGVKVTVTRCLFGLFNQPPKTKRVELLDIIEE